jgi:hypothetical protein
VSLRLLLAAGAVAALAAPAPASRAWAAPPDLTGMWQFDFSPWLERNAAGYHGPAEPPHLTAWVKAKVGAREAAQKAGYVRSVSNMKCLPGGMPSMMSMRPPIQILQAGRWVTVLTEDSSVPRTIHLNMKDHGEYDLSWAGHSIGRWEGDTLVVDTVGLNGRGRFFFDPLPQTETLHIVERIRLIDDGHKLEDRFTFDDPKVFLTPWSFTYLYERLPDAERMEAVCEPDLDALSLVDLEAIREVDGEAARMLDSRLSYNPGGR